MINLDAKYNFIWQPLPISDIFVETPVLATRRKNTCIFVGAFNETKGWQEVRSIVINNPAIHFKLVSKYENDSPGNLGDFPNNVSVYRRLSQEELIKLYDESSYFILGSPLETQCLAAIEAAARGVIIVMKETGLLAESPYANQFGFFGEDLAEEFTKALESKLGSVNPYDALMKMNISSPVLISEWETLLLKELRKSFYPEIDESLKLSGRVLRKIGSPKKVKENA
jgi:hypothetical protein